MGRFLSPVGLDANITVLLDNDLTDCFPIKVSELQDITGESEMEAKVNRRVRREMSLKEKCALIRESKDWNTLRLG